MKKKTTKGPGLRAQSKPALALRKSGSPFARIEDAVEAVRAGQMIIIVDDADRVRAGRPVGAALPVLTLPDRDGLLERVNAEPGGFERVGAMG